MSIYLSTHRSKLIRTKISTSLGLAELNVVSVISMQGHGTEGSHTGVYGNTGTEAGGLFDLILLLLTPDCGTEAEIK